MVMSAYVVPIICSTICNQRIPDVVRKYPHLRDLELADLDPDDGENTERLVQVLVGSGKYWSFVSGHVVRRDASEQVALQTKLVWVL